VLELCPSKSKIVFTPKSYVDVELRIPDIDKAKKILGYNPKVSLDEGLKRTIDWYREKIDSESKLEKGKKVSR
jgi:dTDP-glucose 4,6-dehydratase